MTIYERLNEKDRKKINKLRGSNKPIKSQPKKKQEKLSESDLAELMGMNRPTYKRKNGAIRRR